MLKYSEICDKILNKIMTAIEIGSYKTTFLLNRLI